MRGRWALAAGTAAVLGAGTLALGGQPGQPTFRSGVQVVSLFVTVTDAQRRLVPDLVQDDFEILDNDKPQPITLFESLVQPITVVVMLDTSGSMTGTIGLLRQAAEQFLIRLFPGDKAKVGAFNDKIQVSSSFSSDRDDLVSDVKNLDYGNGTRLYDALLLSLDELKGIEGRRVVLVFTDGDDTASHVGLGSRIDRAPAHDGLVYSDRLEIHY